MATIFLLHSLGLALLFAPVRGIVTNQPLIDQDWGLHFHHLKSLETLWRQDGRLWGYNPFFMAGYPSNTIQDLSIKLFEFLALGLSSLGGAPIQWFKLGAFAGMASVPWLMWLATRNFFAGDETKDRAGAIAALLGTLYWWNSLPREMFFYGMIGFPTASYLSVWGVSLFYRLALTPGPFGSLQVAWLLFAVAILPLHVQSVLTFAPPMIALLAAKPAMWNRRVAGWIMAAAVLAILVNAAWLVPAINHRSDDVSASIVAQLPLFASANPFTFVLDYLGPSGFWSFRPTFMEKGFRLALLILGALGIWRILQGERRALGIALASALLVLFFVTYFGAFVPAIKPWQPLRFKVPFDLFLAIGAVYALSHWLAAGRAERSSLVPALVGCGTIAFLFNLVQSETSGRMYLRTQLKPELKAVVDWIARDTPAGARVLFEESGDESGFVYDGVYLSALVPHLTGRQLIGGPINLYNDRHHFAEFHSGMLLKNSVETLSDEQLRNYLRLYNIGAVVAFHPASIQRLQSIPGLVTVEQRIGPVHLMKVNQQLSWFIEGEGRIKAGLNRLELSEIKGNQVILKYHWVEGLTSSPSTRIEPVKILDDPIPFIKLVSPPANVNLRIGSSD